MHEIKFLAEMMNYPDVINNNKETYKKIQLAKKYQKPIDGHAPSLKGEKLKKYIDAGISTDHENTTKEEAIEKLKYGMKILIREGSAAKNFDILKDLINEYYEDIMFCTDDLHPDDLLKGHINLLVKKAVQNGINPLKVLRCTTYNPKKHYNLDVGLLQKNDYADFIIVNNLKDFNIKEVYINGKIVSKNDEILFTTNNNNKYVNNFSCSTIVEKDIKICSTSKNIKVIKVKDGELFTDYSIEEAYNISDNIESNIKNDILKIIVVNRYQNSKPAIGFIKNFNLKKGAIASSVAHDSHNIIAIGTNDRDIVNAINLLIKQKGGLCAVNGIEKTLLPLPIGGIMTDNNGEKVAYLYSELNKKAQTLGSTLKAPFMTLSFMALLVIPKLKLSDKGLFDGNLFKFVSLFE
jgi:adenine deaminase